MSRARKILTVVGARPQFIKAAVVSAELRGRRGCREVLVHTGQHFDFNMSDVFFAQLKMAPPVHALGIGGGGHAEQTGKMLMALEAVMLTERPDWVLIYGDTNSTLAAALAASKLHVPVAHVEAGLRSFNRNMPEEINRIVADHVSSLLFAPTELAVQQLAREGIRENVHMVGDVMYDIAKRVSESSRQPHEGTMKQVAAGDYILATVHRAENTDDPSRLNTIFDGLVELSRSHQIVVPLHPRTCKALGSRLPSLKGHLTIVEPVGYVEMLSLESSASLIVTDSGGVQKEAYFHRVPCVTLRDETEWVELVETGWNRLCPPGNAAAIVDACRDAIGSRGREVDLYGNGQAAAMIADILCGESGSRAREAPGSQHTYPA